MTITQRLTRGGYVIHLVSSSDLVDVVQCGERLRAYCPIHGSDHQRSLSIDLATGWGFCHSCHATVLVPSMASVIASDLENSYRQRCAHNGSDGTNTAQMAQQAMHTSLVGQVRTTTLLPHWQQEEVAALTTITPMMHEALASSQRVQHYLVDRNLPHTLALATGVWYLSRAVWEQAPVSQEQQQLLKRWVGRIIFPLGSPGGHGAPCRRVPAGWIHRHAVSTTSRSMGQGLERTIPKARPTESVATV